MLEPFSESNKFPANSFFGDKQQRLLISSLYSQLDLSIPLVAAAGVPLYYAIRRSPLVPDVIVSLDTTIREEASENNNQFYLTWEMEKPPDLALEIISHQNHQVLTTEEQLHQKLEDYGRSGVGYYVLFDPDKLVSEQILRIYESRSNHYILQDNTWIQQLNLGLSLWEGEFEQYNACWLRWCDRNDQLLPTAEEQLIKQHHTLTIQKQHQPPQQPVASPQNSVAPQSPSSPPSPPPQPNQATITQDAVSIDNTETISSSFPPKPATPDNKETSSAQQNSLNLRTKLTKKLSTVKRSQTSPQHLLSVTWSKNKENLSNFVKRQKPLVLALRAKPLSITLPLSIAILAGGFVLSSRLLTDSSFTLFENSETSLTPIPPSQLRDISEDNSDWTWNEKVRHLIDKTTLPQYFTKVGYTLPKGSHVYAGRILRNQVGKPAYVFYEAGKGAFDQDFWPASTVKVLAVIGALEFAASKGFSGEATVTFKSRRGKTIYNKRLQEIYAGSIRVSSNIDYDRTLQIAGIDWLNQEFLPPAGFSKTFIQRAYSSNSQSLNSPTMVFSEDNNSENVTVPSRSITVSSPECNKRKNCTNLFELSEAMRRLVLHEEISPEERFNNLFPNDLQRLNEALCNATPSYFAKGATQALGSEPQICHKPGQSKEDGCLDHGVVLPQDDRERYLLAVAIPSQAKSPCSKLSDVAEQVLKALQSEKFAGVPLQPNVGVEMKIQLDVPGSDSLDSPKYKITVTAPKADRIELFLDQTFLGEIESRHSTFVLETPLTQVGERLLIVQAWQDSNLIGYRSHKITIP